MGTALAMLESGPSAALSLRAVCREAGVAPAAAYHHFIDREGLLGAVREEGFARLVERLDGARAEAVAARAQLVAVCAAYVGFARLHRGLYAVMFAPAGRAPNRAHDAFERFVVALAAVDGLASTGQVRGRAMALWAHCHGVAALSMEGVGDAAEVLEDAALGLAELPLRSGLAR